MTALIAIGYGGCFAFVSAVSGDNTGYWIVASTLIGGVSLFAWSAWLAPARYLVLLNTGGSEVVVAEYRESANAERVVNAVIAAMDRINA